MAREMSERSFDDLARGLAEGSISRRRALKLFAGTAIAALIPSTRAMAAITCPPGTVKICHVPRRADGTCRRGAARTLCLSPEAAARHAGHPCDCCGGCGGTDNCREPRPRTCFSTSTTTSTTSTTPTTTTSTSTTSTTTTTSCPPGTVELSNGTCARSCTDGSFDCVAAGCLGCLNEVGSGSGVAYCRGSGGLGDCTSNADCDPGQFCGSSAPPGSGPGSCVTGC